MSESRARIPSLDIIRGVAVMGILAMNATGFAMPETASLNPVAYGGTGGADLFAWGLGFIIFEGKMRGLFSFLFGASMLLVIESAAARGESGASIHYRRMLWLAIFGAIHLYLIWWGDILLHYALVGMIAYFFRGLRLGALIFSILLLLAYQLLLMGSFSLLLIETASAAAAPGADPGAVQLWQELRASLAPLPPAALAEDVALHRGPWWPIVEARLVDHAGTPKLSLMLNGAETLAYMLMGMAALKTGFFIGQWPFPRYRTIALCGLGAGAAGYAILAGLVIRRGFEPASLFAAAQGATILLRPPMILGYAALIILLARPGGRVTDRVAAAGRAAFTNYLGASLLMTTIFYGYGFGLYGQIGRAELYLPVIAAWGLMLAWSKPWLDRYRYGPFEWLWRSLARGRAQPMRR